MFLELGTYPIKHDPNIEVHYIDAHGPNLDVSKMSSGNRAPHTVCDLI